MPAVRAVAAMVASLTAAATSVAGGPDDTQPAPRPALTPVLVQYASAPTDGDIAELEAAGAIVTRRYHLVPGLAARIPAGLEITIDSPRIVAIDADAPGQYFDEYDEAWGVKRIDARAAHVRGVTGKGVRLGIMDSGINPEHPDLAGNYIFGYDFDAMSSAMSDPLSHGTHVSGTSAAVANGVGVIGVAHEADLYMLKVGSWSPTASAAIAALQWAVDNDIHVTNSSFGLEHSSLLEMAYDAAWEAGIVNVVASGNSYSSGIGVPARYASTLAVGATDSQDRRAAFSTYGPELDIVAPGVAVNSTYGASGYRPLDGTSMAAPHATGAAALVIAAGVRDTNGNGRINDEVVERLRATAIDLDTPGFDQRTGWGLLNASAAVDFCRVDLDGSGELDFFDFLEFQSLFAAGDLAADFTGDGVLDFFDFLGFQTEYAAGCP